MRIAGIICEFNPFHDGHKYLIDNVRRELDPDAVVCVMSGNFVQRGQPAMWSKWERAEAACKNGADLVVQMPVCVSLSSAQYFAKGSIDIIKGLNCTDLCFGSVSGKLDDIQNKAINGIDHIEDGNDILAAEYLRLIDNSINPYTVIIDSELGHAQNIRNEQKFNYVNNAFSLIQYAVVSQNADSLTSCPEISEGLENRIKKQISISDDFDSLVKSIKSKRYTYTRISRCLMQILLNIKSSQPQSVYGHVLAFNDTGRKVIKQSSIKLYSSVSPDDCLKNDDLRQDVTADDIYSVITGKNLYKGSDYVCKPIKTNI